MEPASRPAAPPPSGEPDAEVDTEAALPAFLRRPAGLPLARLRCWGCRSSPSPLDATGVLGAAAACLDGVGRMVSTAEGEGAAAAESTSAAMRPCLEDAAAEEEEERGEFWYAHRIGASKVGIFPQLRQQPRRPFGAHRQLDPHLTAGDRIP